MMPPSKATVEVVLSGTPADPHVLTGAPLHLGPEDSGTAAISVVYRAAAGAKPVLSGGLPVSKWTEQQPGHWHAPLPPGTESSNSLDRRTLRIFGVK